ncbi:MAG TPA: replication initiator [Candidatus Limnocylindria bacterium]|nr:replication initiator [Candidatus Limnocylindria bacterium]
MLLSNSKIIITPNAIHVTYFEKAYAYDFTRKKRRQRNREISPRNGNNLLSLWRASKQVKLILESNTRPEAFFVGATAKPLFVTLTFAENVTDIARANKEFKRFTQRLNRAIGLQQKQLGFSETQPLHYLVVPEFQKRGAVHYHIIYFAFPIQKDTNKFLSKIWGHGFTFNATIKNPNHLKNYVTKYFLKSQSDPRLKGKKHYFCSKNILRPNLSRSQAQNNAIINILQNSEAYQKEYLKDGKLVLYSVYDGHPLINLLYKNKEAYKHESGLRPKQKEFKF